MKKMVLALFATLLFLTSCTDKSKIIELTEKSFGEEVELTQSFTFTFDKDIKGENEINLWDSVEYIEFDPEIRGRYMWIAPNILQFSPVNYLTPATKYNGELTKLILKNTGYSFDGETSFSFHTPYLKLEMANAFWAASGKNGNNPTVHLNFTFNYDVKPAEVEDLMEIKIDGDVQEFKLIDEKTGNLVSVYLPNINIEDKVLLANVVISKGLSSINGTLKTQEDMVEEMDIASPFKLTINEITTDHDGMSGVLHVYTSQRVDDQTVRNFIDITPNVTYTLDIQDQEFVIKSEDFDVTEKYELTVKQDLQGALGGKLKYDYSQEISFGKLQPSIKFVDKKSMYISEKGSREMLINIINVPKVNVKITKIYENNILSFLGKNSNYYYDDYGYDDYYYDDYYYDDYGSNTSDLGDVVYQEEINTMELPKDGNNRKLKLDFPDKIKDFNGIYIVEVNSPDEYYLKDKKVVSVTDIGLIAKAGKNSVSVFVNSIKKAEPMANVSVHFIGRNNQVAATVKTNDQGYAVFEQGVLPAPGFEIKLITAELGGDYNYLPFSNTYINSSKFEVGGRRENLSGYDAFLYGDRDIYRPGETVYLTAVLRDNNWKVPGKVPVVLKLMTPSGKEFKFIRKTLNEHGSFETSIDLSASAMTGSYTAQLYTGNDIFLTSKYIKVEEFVPDRIKVKIDLDKEEARTGSTITLNINATNFFGPPAANKNYEVDMSTRRKYFYSKENPGYNYYIEGAMTYFSNVFREDVTDEQGNGVEEYTIPKVYDHMGMLESDFYVTVFDETGRPVSRRKTVTILTQDVYYGIKNDYGYYKTGQKAVIPIIAVDKEGKALNGVEAHLRLIKHEYKTVLSKSGGYFRYRSEHEERILEDKVIKLSGTQGTFEFIPDLSGTYEIRISAPGVNTYVTKSVYCYGWGRTTYSSFEVNNEGEIDIELDKENYIVGDKAKVILKTPFSGKMLVTVENNGIIDHFYLTTDKRAASFELDIKPEFVPNVYITATLFREHEKSDLPLTVAHGIVPVLIENPSNKLPLVIKAAKQSRSRTKQMIRIESAPNSAVTVAVVDEGILQLTGYLTPDPYAFFYAKRALEVNSYNVYPYIFPELDGKSLSGGGDSDMDKRLNPMNNKRIKLVAMWSGILETNGSGIAEYEIDIPQFSGDLRIMAANYKNQAFAGTHVNMIVADPLVISTALPRFLSPGDTVEVPVSLSNTTEKKTDCEVTLTLVGPVKVVGKNSKSVKINANTEENIDFRVVAAPEIGEAKFTIQAEALSEKFTNETDISIRPASPLQKINGYGITKAGTTTKINMDVGSFIKQSVDNKLVVSKSPLVNFADDLDYLIMYPYGCVEQTVSKAFPQIYFQDIVKDILGSKGKNLNPAHNVQEAINKLMLMQLYNGGLTYWPGEGSETWWGSVYAAHFLTEAKKAGFQVDQSMLDKLYDYLITKLKTKTTTTYYYNYTLKREVAPKEVAYSLYILALADQPQRSTMNYYKSNKEQLCLDSKYLLAAAFAISGDTKSYKQIVPSAFEGEKANKEFGGSFYSYVRDEAIALNAMLDADPDNPQVAIMAKHVSEFLKTQRWLNTQERVFCFLAMGKIAQRANKSDIKAKILSNGKVIGTFDNKTLTFKTKELNGTSMEIQASGTGELYYFWEAEGISADGSYKEEDSFMAVRKEFYDRNGNRILNNTFRQNDLVVVKLSLEGTSNYYVANVVISDILPAGFEIENPRLTEMANFAWIQDKSWPTYSDIRDDRMNLFVDVSRSKRNYYYMVRAVSRGVFQMGPVGADAMYNGEYHSYSGGGTVTILEK